MPTHNSQRGFAIPSALILPLILGGAFALLFGMDRYHVAQRNEARADLAAMRAEWEKQRQRADALADNGKSIAEQVGLTHIRTITRTRKVIERVRDEIPVYVPTVADAGCVVPNGWVSIHDAAASGADLSAAASGHQQADSGVVLSEIASVLASNYERCHEYRAESVAWREWYKRNADAYRAANQVKGIEP